MDVIVPGAGGVTVSVTSDLDSITLVNMVKVAIHTWYSKYMTTDRVVTGQLTFSDQQVMTNTICTSQLWPETLVKWNFSIIPYSDLQKRGIVFHFEYNIDIAGNQGGNFLKWRDAWQPDIKTRS